MPRRVPRWTGAVPARTAVLLATLVLVLSACSEAAPLKPKSSVEQVKPPELGACYRLTPKDTQQSSSDVEPVPCAQPHTSQTFAIGSLPDSTGDDRSSPAHGKWVFDTCQKAFQKFLSVDESMAMRVQLSWAWFRPPEEAWKSGSRWYRCDLVGGPASAAEYRALPTDAKGLFRAKPPEQWLTCATGDQFDASKQVPCSQPHTWRAVTTIKLGEPDDPYPGDRLAQVRSRNFCSDSVGAWMNYPVDYEYAVTAFHEGEWKAGNRRTVCWAKTDR